MRIEWRQSRLAKTQRDIVVWVDAKAADEAWSSDEGYYLLPGGEYRRREYMHFGKTLPRRKIRVPMVEAAMLQGQLIITAGDFIFRYLVDHGAMALPFSMPWPSGNRAMSQLGTDVRVCEIVHK